MEVEMVAKAPRSKGVLDARLTRLVGEVSRFWGLGIEVCLEDRSPSFNWYAVTLPQEAFCEATTS